MEVAHLLAGGERRAKPGRRVEGGNTGSAGTDRLCEGALRQADELDLTRSPQRFEGRQLLAMAARSAADDLAHKPGFDQLMGERVAVRRRVDDEGEALGSALPQRADQHIGEAGAAEPGNE